MVCVDNPANPTGFMLTADEVAALRRGLRDDILLVLDAAYAEYVTDKNYAPGDALADAGGVTGGNTVMLRTFSKIYGLAGARVGWAYCPAAVAAVLNRVRLPNNVTAPSQAAALAALSESARVADIAAQNAALRERFLRRHHGVGIDRVSKSGELCAGAFCRRRKRRRRRAMRCNRAVFTGVRWRHIICPIASGLASDKTPK